MSEPLIPGGFIILARRIRKSLFWKSLKSAHRAVMTEILLMAQFQDGPVVRNGEIVNLKRGQLATSLGDIVTAVDDKDITLKVVRNAIDKMVKCDFLLKDEVVSASKKGLLLTIVNYDFYQNIDNYKKSDNEASRKLRKSKTSKMGIGTGNDKDVINPYRESESSDRESKTGRGTGNERAEQGQSKGRVRAISNNVNNYNNDLKTLSRQSKTYAEDSPYYRMAVYFYDRLQTFVNSIGKGHLIQNSNLQIWADDFRKMIELDKRPRNELGEVVNWATSDPFWQKNILSPDKLRKKYTELCLKMASNNGLISNSNVNDKLFEKNKAEAKKIMEAMEREGIGNKDVVLKNQ